MLLWAYLGRLTEQTGEPHPRVRYALVSIVLFAADRLVRRRRGAAARRRPGRAGRHGDVMMPLDQARASGALTADDELQYSSEPLTLALPQRAGLRFSSGTTLDPRYIALLLALVIYTAAFIAEIVRAGSSPCRTGRSRRRARSA